MVDPVIEARRQAYIERLYERSGRSCSTYSGLLLQHIQHLIEEDMAASSAWKPPHHDDA